MSSGGDERSVIDRIWIFAQFNQGAFLLLVENARINPEMLGEVGVEGGLWDEDANLTPWIEVWEPLLDEGDLWRDSRRQSSSVTLAEGRDGGVQSSSNSVNFEVTMFVVWGWVIAMLIWGSEESNAGLAIGEERDSLICRTEIQSVRKGGINNSFEPFVYRKPRYRVQPSLQAQRSWWITRKTKSSAHVALSKS